MLPESNAVSWIDPKSRTSVAFLDDLIVLNDQAKRMTSMRWSAHCHVF
jgi:hypothetical protein